mmetsp:Transcript_25367/g.35409  ORF Transcript_25367/g.35409 Transcript_25367/m.35409 type:complete len:131 (+) Transcript_25367:318-710(+)
MMVHLQYASLADMAMVRPRWPRAPTKTTESWIAAMKALSRNTHVIFQNCKARTSRCTLDVVIEHGDGEVCDHQRAKDSTAGEEGVHLYKGAVVLKICVHDNPNQKPYKREEYRPGQSRGEVESFQRVEQT